jgi:hypothetical protein
VLQLFWQVTLSVPDPRQASRCCRSCSALATYLQNMGFGARGGSLVLSSQHA